MPELPEVETVRRGLAPVMEGRMILGAQVRREGLRWPFPERLAERLTGARVLGLARRSKYILIGLDRGETALLHLGMSGRMTISGHVATHVPGKFHHDHPPLERHDHVVLEMEGGARITLNDARRFGALDLISTEGLEAHPLLSKIGPEPLGNAFNASYLIASALGRRTPIKAFLLDQTIVAGLGNIYVCEALHRAGIHPRRLAGDIAAPALELLTRVIREVLEEAIEAGGSSLKDYRQATGELGYFQHGFAVYDRAGQPCLRPGCGGIIERITQSGRSTWFCPVCQS